MKTNDLKLFGQISIACLLCNAVGAFAVERYVDVNNPTPTAPYLTWATAANDIQSAIDAASAGDVITVTNGTYQTGTSVVNRVYISKPLLVRSVNGPEVTIIDGGGTVRCVALDGNAVLSGFTLTNGYATNSNNFGYGGGAVGTDSFGQKTLTNCIITGNIASVHGGGVARCRLDNCVVSNNYAGQSGGGTLQCPVNNSTVVNNVAAFSGGGGRNSDMTNCFVSGNSASSGGGAVAAVVGETRGTYFVNCTFVNNRATGTNGVGGGVFSSESTYPTRLYNCTFTSNSASAGGGVFSGRLYDCALVGNHATNGVGAGGGATYSYLERCLVVGNFANKGGGVFGGYIDGLTLPYGHGVGTVRCVIAGNSANAGGGIYGNGGHSFAVVTNNFAGNGGGSANDDTYVTSTEFDTCLFAGNVATNRGGAIYGSGQSRNSTIAGNSAGIEGGGICGTTDYFPQVERTIIYHNSAPLHANHNTNSSVFESCTTPMPANGDYNFTNDPLFVILAAGNYRLSSNSPCINYFYNPNPADPQLVDLDGNLRQAGTGIDVGAYEFQFPSAAISYLWLQQHGLPTDGSADYADQDGDLFNNFSEWRARTDPSDAASLLQFSSISIVTNGSDLLTRLEWQSVPGVYYSLTSATNAAGPFTSMGNDVLADSTNTIRQISVDPAERSRFFRVGVW